MRRDRLIDPHRYPHLLEPGNQDDLRPALTHHGYHLVSIANAATPDLHGIGDG